MAFPFDLTDNATADMEEAVAYLAAENMGAALRVADELEDAFRFLAEWPGAGHRRQDLTDSPDARFWMSGRYLIVYLTPSERILVVAVFHGAQDAKSLLPRRLQML
jgi:toxin ParE1/3/4